MIGYGIRKSGDDGFIIAMAAFICVLNICKLKLTYESWLKIGFNLPELLMFRRMISKQFDFIFIIVAINLSSY